MADAEPIFFDRLKIAAAALWRILADAEFASRVSSLLASGNSPAEAADELPTLAATDPDSALQMLSLLQQQGRFIDFLEEDITGYADQDVGAAARLVHEGCRRVLREHLTIEPVRTEPEGEAVTVEEGFDASAIRLTGNLVGQAPFSGRLIHRGWQVTEVRLPQMASGHNFSVLATAEVEL
jgi:hypothetical protein